MGLLDKWSRPQQDNSSSYPSSINLCKTDCLYLRRFHGEFFYICTCPFKKETNNKVNPSSFPRSFFNIVPNQSPCRNPETQQIPNRQGNLEQKTA